ncbi:unnamed protein product [Amoebophrya sp. A25]|nr:unnamed protein product [Amoebophrya sp. A25]|eukprot:GSA25T00010559001.1
MGVPAQVQTAWKEFDAEYKKNGPNSEPLLAKVKVELAKLGNQLLLETQEPKVLELAREVYEKGAFLSIKKNDPAAFERNVKQLKMYYRDFDKRIQTKSSNEYKILGLYLLFLLSSDRIGEFHTELELVPEHDSHFIQRPVMLERYLMEGNYAKINESVVEFSAQEHYPVFLQQLQETMRRRILDSLERSTSSIAVDRVSKMLYMKSAAEVGAFLKKVGEESDSLMQDVDVESGSKWEIVGQKMQLISTSRSERIPVMETLGNVIDYATEIERIV